MTEAPWRRRFRAARVTLPVWARDNAQRLLYASNASGKFELYTWDREAERHVQLTDRPEGTLEGHLDPTGEWVWWLDDERGNEFGRWVVQPFRGGERLTEADLPPAYYAGLALGRGFAVVGSSRDKGSTVHLIRSGEAPRLLYSHREEAAVAALSRDESLICLSHSEHGDSRHPALRVIDREGRSLGDLWDGPGKGLEAVGWSPIAGDQRLLVQHERQDLARPLIWDLSTGHTTELPIDLPGEVEASWYPDASALLLRHDYRGRGELYRLDLTTASLQRLETEPGTISRANVRPDGEVWYEWGCSSTPPQIRAGDHVLLEAPGEKAPGGVAYSDGMVDGVHYFLAEPASPRPHPTVFQIHGGPPSHDRDSFSPLVQAWVDHGLAVVLVNYRGSTGYGRAWRDGLQGNPGFTELEDIAKVQDYLVSIGVADPTRMVLSGRSWGGYLTLLGLGTQPERWSLGVAGVPVADYVAAFEDEMEPLKAFDRALFGGSPMERPEFYVQRSPITYVEQVRVPVLITAGENDPRCPIRQIENYVARLQALGKPHQVYRYQAGHGSLKVDESIRQMEVFLDFVARHLGTKPPA